MSLALEPRRATIVAYRLERDGTVHQSMLADDHSVRLFKRLALMFRQTTVLYLVRCRAKAERPTDA
jgi:hypothetical protein